MLPPSSLSIVCSKLAQFVHSEIGAAGSNINVMLGAPADAVGDSSQQRLNLFFYRFEPGGFDSAVRPDQMWRIRMWCLITGFGVTEDNVSSGENDLRMLGEIMRIFHENPVLTFTDINPATQLQVVFAPLSDDQINQIWSTQGEANYRPSVAYEMALTPIVPRETYTAPPRVGSLGAAAYAEPVGRHRAFDGAPFTPPVQRYQADLENPDWIPGLCLIYQGVCRQTLALDVTNADFANFTLLVWLAGNLSSTVTLQWETWRPEEGWVSAGKLTAQPHGSTIDPGTMPPTSSDFPLRLSLPVSLAINQRAVQALLYAVRTDNPPSVSPRTLRSNPVLISLYRTP
jgi:hypothetical protein